MAPAPKKAQSHYKLRDGWWVQQKETNNRIEDGFGDISLETEVSEVGDSGETETGIVVDVGIKILSI